MGLKATEFGKMMQNNGHSRSRSIKVTDFGTNQKPICNFLLVNNEHVYSTKMSDNTNTNLPPILHHFRDMGDYWSNFR